MEMVNLIMCMSLSVGQVKTKPELSPSLSQLSHYIICCAILTVRANHSQVRAI